MSFVNLFPTLDLFILFLYAAGVVLHLVFIKKSRLFINFVSLYISFALIIILPIFIPQVAIWLSVHYYTRAAAFVGLYLVLTFIFRFSNLGGFSQAVSPTQFITSLVYRLAIVGLIFTTVMYFLPSTFKQQFGVFTQTVFISFGALVVWFILPILFAFAYRFKTRRGWVE